MKFCILFGSPRPRGNTAELLKPFIRRLEETGSSVDLISLYDKEIKPCMGCYACQDVEGQYGCRIADDVPKIFDRVIAADCVVLATPIYTWYCTAPMKALLDRHFCLNKFYRSGTGSLWAGKSVAILATHGYDAQYGAGPFEDGVKRLCEHSALQYLGMYSVRDIDDLPSFQTPQSVAGALEFADRLLCALSK